MTEFKEKKDPEKFVEDTREVSFAQGHGELERGLKSRHIQFLALGGLSPIPQHTAG